MIIFTSPVVIEKKGKLPGKNIVVMVGVHGNESFGVDAIRELIPKLKLNKGKVTFIIANPEAVKQNKRFIEYNLNRCFLKNQPQNIFNSYEGKIARDIMPIFEEADWLLDIHGSNSFNSIPFVICREQSFDLASNLQLSIISYNWDKFQPGSSDYYMNLQNKIGICVECGCIKDKKSRNVAKEVTLDFLILAGAIKGEVSKLNDKRFIKIVKLYRNRFGEFRKIRDFADFERLAKKELIGKDGDKEIYGKREDILLFVRDREKIGEECFLVAKETLLNSKYVNELLRIKQKRRAKWQ